MDNGCSFDIGIIALEKEKKVTEGLKKLLEKDKLSVGTWIVNKTENTADAYDFAKNKSDYLILIVTQDFLKEEQGIQAVHIGKVKSELQNCRKVFVVQMAEICVI